MPARLLLFAFFVYLSAACRAETDAPATATNPPEPTTAASATATITPPPTPLPQPVVISTPTANTLVQPTETIEPAATATQPIPGLIGPDSFPPNVNPLTGETVGDPAVLARRPLAVKVSNYPPIVRPQNGLNNADLLFEHYAEGGVTRFTAVFYGKDAAPVGSVRSGRLIDLEVAVMYDAAFAYSGASGPVRELIRNSSFFSRVISPDFGHGGFVRITDPNRPDKPFEHTLFTDTGTLRAILQARGENGPPQFHSSMLFRLEPVTPGTAASSLEIRYLGTNAFWQYNPGAGRYTRWTDGQPHLDANTGSQLNFKNIIVLGAHHEDTDILEDLVAGGHYSIQIQIWGEGPVSIFRDGQRFEGRWRREDPSQMLTFYDLEGNILPLSPGNSFYQVVPLGFTGLVVTP